MIECCQNCRFFVVESESCLNRALEAENSLNDQLYDLLESGKIHEMVREFNIDDLIIENKIAEEIAAFFQDNLDGDAHVHIVDAQTFRCNQYA
jgi:hypothetical protein